MDKKIVAQPDRKSKARHLVAAGEVHPQGFDRFHVDSQEPGVFYTVTLAPRIQACTCPDYIYRKARCKHIQAVELFNVIRSEITEFLQRRQDVDIEQFLSTMRKRNPPAGDAVKNTCYIAVGEYLQTHYPPPRPDALKKALVFSVRYWWPAMDAAKLWDPTTSDFIEQPAGGIETKSHQHDWQRSAADHVEIRDLVEDRGYRLGDARIANSRRAGSRREWLFEFPVYKTQEVN